MKLVHLTLAALFACATAWAQVTPEEHAAHHPPEAAATPAPPKPTASASTGDLEQRMASMQELMDRLNKARDPAQRKRLLKQHSDAMRAQIHALTGMECPMKMGMGMKADMGKSDSDKCVTKPGSVDEPGMSGATMRCHDMMKFRVEMTLQMMDQLLQHQDAVSAGK